MVKTEQSKCENCGLAEFEDLGLMPLKVLEDDSDSSVWVRVKGCCSCGAMDVIDPKYADVSRGDGRYLDFLVRNGFISKEERKHIENGT